MRTRLKICGVTSRDDARAAVDCGADLLGFNFYPKSPRYVTPDAARSMIEALPLYITAVGILVSPTADEMITTHKQSGVGALQVYDAENVTRFDAFDFPIVLGKRMRPGEVPRWPENGASMLLLDTYSPSEYGGTGSQFAWSDIPASIPRERLILAGGINVENVAEAVRTVRPAIIDVASGAESAPGKKDRVLIAALVEKMRNADAL